MAETILFPNTTTIAATYLRGLLDPVHVGSKIPNPRPTEFVTCRRTGGLSDDVVIDRAQITVESWSGHKGGSEQGAHDLAQQVRGHLLAMAGTVQSGHTIYAVREVSGPVPVADPESGQPRFRQTFQIGVRGAAI